MIGYVTLGTNDLDRAARFYDGLLAEIGAGRVIKPWDGKPATVGNGVMVALVVDSPAKVDALYRKAMELNGTDEGKPGPRGDGFYAAYFRDLDGNKLNFFCFG